MTYRVVLTDQEFSDTEIEEAILAEVDARLEVLDDPSPDSIRARAADADALLNTYAAIDRDTFAALQKCKIVSRYGIGVDNIDLDAARERDIVVTNVPDYCVAEVADHTLALILAAIRKILHGNEIVRSGGWGIAALRPIRRINSMSLGLIGFGNIGRSVARRAAAFGFTVACYDPYLADEVFAAEGLRRAASLDELLADADVVSIHVPLVEETRGLVGRDAIAKMKQGAILVNTARGPIVDTQAVVGALRDGRLAAAALDVFASEPPDASELAGVPGLIATPHSAYYSEESVKESQTKAARAVADVLSGKDPIYRVA